MVKNLGALDVDVLVMSDLVLDLRGIRKTYRGGVEALKGVDLQVPRGCIYGLLGPNGAGKSTLVKILTTLIRRTGGEGTMLGLPIGDREGLKRVGLLPEHARFPDYLTGRQVIEFTAGLQEVPKGAVSGRVDDLLEKVGMVEAQGRKMKGYSKGMKQRIGIAQALVNDPEIVFLDEPTDGVDPAGRRDFRELMKDLKAEGRTIFINTHILSELEPIVDRVAIIAGGELKGEGVLDDLRQGGDEYRVEFVGDLSEEVARKFAEEGMGVAPGMIVVGSSQVEEVQPVIDGLRAAGVMVSKVEQRRESLEDLFMNLVEVSPNVGPPPMPGVNVA